MKYQIWSSEAVDTLELPLYDTREEAEAMLSKFIHPELYKVIEANQPAQPTEAAALRARVAALESELDMKQRSINELETKCANMFHELTSLKSLGSYDKKQQKRKRDAINKLLNEWNGYNGDDIVSQLRIKLNLNKKAQP